MRTGERGNFNRGAQSGLAVGNGKAEDEVIAFALEDLVLLDADKAVTVAWRAARVGALFTVACQSHSHTVIDALGDRDVELGTLFGLATAAAVGAGIGDKRSCAAACGAGGLNAEYAGGLDDLTTAAALAALGSLRAGLAAGAFAGV